MFDEIDQILLDREYNYPDQLLKARQMLLDILGEEPAGQGGE